MNRKLLLLLIILLFFGGLFWLRCSMLLDADFGWHLRMGQIILSYGIPLIDPFSYTMSHYSLIDHEWLSNVFLAMVYPHLGFIGVAGVFSLITILAVYIRVSRVSVTSLWPLAVPLLLSMITLLDAVRINVQIIDWLFLAILSEILFDKNLYKILRFILPVIFLLWSNLHGGFVLGIGIYCIFLIFHERKRLKQAILDILLFVCSIGSTFLSPYHTKLWEEVFRNIATRGVYTNISEWMPTILFLNFFAFWIYFPLSVILVISNKHLFTRGEGVVFGLLAVLSMTSLRNVPLFIIFSLPLTIRAYDAFAKEESVTTRGKKIFLRNSSVAIAMILLLGLWQGSYDLRLAYASSENNAYPKQALAYLKQHPFKGNFFTPFTWGGYMVWKYPEKKVYIDGMMAAWKDNTFPGESKNAFQDYIALLDKKRSLKKDIKQYGITTVLLPASVSTVNTSFLSAKELQELGLHLVYKDTVSEIYTRE